MTLRDQYNDIISVTTTQPNKLAYIEKLNTKHKQTDGL